MQVRSISVEERSALQELESNGPHRAFSRRVTGRLNLYGLINEGPRGWFITEAGRRMLRSGRVVPLSPEQMLFALGPVLATANDMDWADGEERFAAA